jgi:hypothetical protein
MEKNNATVEVDSLITVTSPNGTKIHLNNDLIQQLHDFVRMEEIPKVVDSLKDSIIDLSAFKILLDKENNEYSELLQIDPDFIFYLKHLIDLLKALDSCNKFEFASNDKGGGK